MSETGRYYVRDQKSGRLFCVEPLNARNQKLDDMQFTNGGITQVRGGSVPEAESVIRPENGFTNIVDLPAGTSPDAWIEQMLRG